MKSSTSAAQADALPTDGHRQTPSPRAVSVVIGSMGICLFCCFRFELLLLHGLQAHFLVHLFEPLLHVLESLEFR
jgi:hypothetical protein